MHNPKEKFLVILFLCIIATVNEAQKKASINPSVIGIRSQLSYVIIHSRDLRPMGNTYPLGFGIDIKKRYTSRKTWENCNCYPMLGFSFTYWDFNNPRILGKGFSSLFFVEPFFGFKRKINVSLRAGFGIAYLSNPYDSINNPDNYSYSTHLGFPLLLGLNLNYQVTPKININTGIYYNHISNGGVKYPNKGINYPALAFGIDYYLKPAKLKIYPETEWKNDSAERKRQDAFLIMAMTSIDPKETARYAVFGAAYNFSYRIARISALNAGFEWILDASLQRKLERENDDSDYQRGGILLGHEFLLGHFTFSQQLGVYLYNPSQRGDPVYQRYGLNYYIKKKLIIGFNLKAHRQVADFMDLRLGFSF